MVVDAGFAVVEGVPPTAPMESVLFVVLAVLVCPVPPFLLILFIDCEFSPPKQLKKLFTFTEDESLPVFG